MSGCATGVARGRGAQIPEPLCCIKFRPSDAVVGREPLAAMKNSNLVSVLIYHRTSVTPVPVCRPRQSRQNKPSRCGVGCCSALQSLNAAQMRTLMSKKSFPSAERRQIARLPQGVHRVRVQTTSSRDDAQRRLRAACAENAAAEHLTTGASTAFALRYSTIYCKARSKRRTRL